MDETFGPINEEPAVALRLKIEHLVRYPTAAQAGHLAQLFRKFDPSAPKGLSAPAFAAVVESGKAAGDAAACVSAGRALLAEHPASPLIPRVMLEVGDAQLQAGRPDLARKTFTWLAQSYVGLPEAQAAVQRLNAMPAARPVGVASLTSLEQGVAAAPSPTSSLAPPLGAAPEVYRQPAPQVLELDYGHNHPGRDRAMGQSPIAGIGAQPRGAGTASAPPPLPTAPGWRRYDLDAGRRALLAKARTKTTMAGVVAVAMGVGTAGYGMLHPGQVAQMIAAAAAYFVLAVLVMRMFRLAALGLFLASLVFAFVSVQGGAPTWVVVASAFGCFATLLGVAGALNFHQVMREQR